MVLLRGVGEALVPRVVRQVAAPIILAILLMFYYVNGPLIFAGLWDEPGFSNAILAYLSFVFLAFLFAAVPPKNPIAKDLFNPVQASLLLQLGVFLAVSVGVNTLIALSGLRLSTAAITGVTLVQLALFQLAVAGSEELFFRGAMFRFGPLVSSGAFAAFHAYVYSSSSAFALAIAFAAVAGFAFYYIYAVTRERYGLAVNTAAHWAYNCALLGVVFIGPLFTAFFG